MATRAYVSFATLKEERPLYLHLLASLRLMGLMGGPLFGFMFINVDFVLWNEGPIVSKYTAPALFCALLGVGLFVTILLALKEFKFPSSEELRTTSERARDKNKGENHDNHEHHHNETKRGREYRVSEVTPLVSEKREKGLYLDRTGLLIANMMLLVVGSTYSVFSVLQPLLSYDNFGWGIKENYAFFGVSLLMCVLCCVLMPVVLIYVDGRAVVVGSLVMTAAGFLGRIHFEGNGEAWKVQFLSVSVTLVVMGYTSCSVVLFGLFTKQLGLGESMFAVNVALAFVNFAQALTPLWAIALYNVDNEGNVVWGVMAMALVGSALILLLFWRRLIPTAKPQLSVNKAGGGGGGGRGRDGMQGEEGDEQEEGDEEGEEVISSFRYPHRDSASTLNQAKFQAWRASLSRHLPMNTPDSGHGFATEEVKRRQRKGHKKHKSPKKGGGGGGGGSDDGEITDGHSDKASKKTKSGRSTPANDGFLFGNALGEEEEEEGGHEDNEGGGERGGGGGGGEGQQRGIRAHRPKRRVGSSAASSLRKGGGVDHQGEEDVVEGRSRRGTRVDDSVDGEDGAAREEEEEEEDNDYDDGDDNDDNDESGDETGESFYEEDDFDQGTVQDDASEMDDAPELATPRGSVLRPDMQKLSRKYSKTTTSGSFSKSF